MASCACFPAQSYQCLYALIKLTFAQVNFSLWLLLLLYCESVCVHTKWDQCAQCVPYSIILRKAMCVRVCVCVKFSPHTTLFYSYGSIDSSCSFITKIVGVVIVVIFVIINPFDLQIVRYWCDILSIKKLQKQNTC